MTDQNSEFKGETKQSLFDIRGDISELKLQITHLSNRFWVVILIVTILAIEKAPGFLQLISSSVAAKK